MNRNEFMRILKNFNTNHIRTRRKNANRHGNRVNIVILPHKNSQVGAAFLRVTFNGNSVSLESGETHPNFRRKGGYGTFIRALATWAAIKSGAHNVRHIGINRENLIAKAHPNNNNRPPPISTQIVRNKLGFRATNKTKSVFNKTMSLNKIENALAKRPYVSR